MGSTEDLVERIVHNYRWIFVLLFLLPLSFIYDTYFSIRDVVVHWLQSAPRAHSRKVGKIQQQVREWNESGRKTKMCTARSGFATMSFRIPTYKKQMTQIRTDSLIDILELNINEEYVLVEPMVTMGQLTRYLIPKGYTLPITPELDDLTVGGMINGCGVEASSKKYGLFQHICISYDLVLSDGSLITAEKESDNNSSDTSTLFYGVPWSHGTLGFLVAAKLRIIKCKQFVKLTYTPTDSVTAIQESLKKEAEDKDNEFVEGIMYSKSTGVIMKGRFSDGGDGDVKVNNIGKWHKKWFYTHVEDIYNSGKVVTELIPLRDYYHRHSRSIFWELKEIIPFGNNVLFRWLLGWLCPPKITLLKLTTPPILRRLYDRKHVIQDMLVPIDALASTVNVFHEEVKIYPLWLCPFVQPSCPGMIRQRTGKSIMYVDVGAYGISENPEYNARETTRRLEEFVRNSKGFQMLYADTYMSRAEFWEMFDSSIYDWLRVKYHCKDAFPDVYDKVCKAARY